MGQELTERVEQVLDKQVRPTLAEHGGDVRVVSLENGLLKLRTMGPCANCPSAVYETEEHFGEIIKGQIQEIQDVVLVTGVSDDLLAQARALMGRA